MQYDAKPYFFRHAFTGRFALTGIDATHVYHLLSALRSRALDYDDENLTRFVQDLEKQAHAVFTSGSIALQNGRTIFTASEDGSGAEASPARAYRPRRPR